jgi:2-polyprenyl-3-methyl-5-hydroxy-6-metoxy-1,4-benzoquinol methylase
MNSRFGEEVMETVAAWTARICVAVAAGLPWDPVDGFAMAPRGLSEMSSGGSMALELANWNVLDLGTGNGLFLHALFKQGFTDLTGTDYSQGAVELAGAVAERSNVDNITFLVDDILDSKLNRQFQLVTDKGTLDAIGLHPDGVAHRFQYWKALCKLVAPGGVLVITSCNSTKDELVAEVNAVSQSWKVNEHGAKEDKDTTSHCSLSTRLTFEYIDHIRTYPTFRFGGIEGSQVSTVAFLLKA